MSKKTWTTLIIVVLVIAAAVAIYFATRPPAEVEPTPTPIVEITEAPETVTDADVETPVTDAPVTP
ncbi:MAG: hypothetical protein PHP07_06960 [Eubacteriales bacterium]|nr:hypothetical protein [Eubacteriales bacterium]